ncbi:hypothetical protein FVE85_1176 [Porphyridium purpureum]|uniref:Pentatricopeptide repeat-containing protein n=1 Tax=Porphyridium purpureum TaxID=35688 RepID=A0A5J4Z4E1_PORPP|nr:hypothetical protein FVE85_1176 [Porphyridium purpureum]|eukprot:POR4319..scf208_2
MVGRHASSISTDFDNDESCLFEPLPKRDARRSLKRPPATQELNDALKDALEKQMGIVGVRRILAETHAVRFDRWTLDFLLRLARSAPDVDARQRFEFAISMIQKTRKQGVALDSFSLAQFLPIARARRSVNAVLALKNLIQTRGHALSDFVCMGLIRHFGICNRAELVEKAILEMTRLHDVPDAKIFASVLTDLLRNDNSSGAQKVWTMLHGEPLSSRVKPDADLLQCGLLVCSRLKNSLDRAHEARWIIAKYREHEIVPTSDAVNALAAILISAGEFEEARSVMYWTIDLCYTLHANRISQYVQECLRLSRGPELLPLADILTQTTRLGPDKRDRREALDQYLCALDTSASAALLDPKAPDRCAKRVEVFWGLSHPTRWKQ